MKIRFEERGFSLFPNFKGGEKDLSANMFYDGTNRIFKGRLAPGASIGLHTHEDSCEVIFILDGNGTLTEIAPEGEMASATGGKPDAGKEGAPAIQPVSSGDCLYCPKGHTHSLKNTDPSQDLVFYAVVAMQ